MSNEIQQDLVKSLLKEKRSDRWWRNIRAILWMLVLVLYAVFIFGGSSGPSTPKGPYVSLVRLSGSIMPDNPFSVQKAAPALYSAFSDPDSRGVILLINSPGGSAAQASIIHDRILELKRRFKKKVVVVSEDALASGAYLVATAADKIYVNRDTLTGSIGVIMSSFGFVDAIQKLGITRRLYTAGVNKDRLDPFQEVTPADVTKIKSVIDEVHADFIQDVVQSRGKLLKGDRADLFSGDFWTGGKAVELGLADGVGDLWTVMKKEFNVAYVKNYSPHPSLMEALFKTASTELRLGLTQQDAVFKAQAY